MAMIRIPVLTYHSYQVSGNTYETNDHIALFHDLRTIQELGFHVVPLLWVVEWVLGQREDAFLHRAVAFSFDDGADFDYYDLEHPSCGPQRSFYNILRDFQDEFGFAAQPHLHASSFVIASPTVRDTLDAQGLIGKGWMSDGWWAEADRSGIMSIYNHSWDHVHPVASQVYQKNQIKGAFELIDTYTECQGEVEQAARYIHQKISPSWPSLFAYPGGQSSEYIRDIYFPRFQDQHHTLAAFDASGGSVTKTSSRWNLPRLMCGAHWQSTERLIRILKEGE
jgi:hypothetical protein